MRRLTLTLAAASAIGLSAVLVTGLASPTALAVHSATASGHYSNFQVNSAGPATTIHVRVVQATTPTDTRTYKTVRADCPAGTTVIAGGAAIFWAIGEAATLHPHLISSFIFGTNGWYGEAAAPSSATGAWSLTVQAICMT